MPLFVKAFFLYLFIWLDLLFTILLPQKKGKKKLVSPCSLCCAISSSHSLYFYPNPNHA